MFLNYIKTAWRNILHNKVYSALNIFGLATGMAVALLIGLWVFREYSYDRFIPGYENLYQVKLNYKSNDGDTTTISSASLALAEALRKEIPGIQYVAETDWNDRHGLMAGDKKLLLNGTGANPDFLRAFGFPLLSGQVAQVLNDPYSIVLTETTAKALFGNADPVNKIVRLDNHYDLKVTGILKDLPANSSFGFKYLVPFKFYEQTQDWMRLARTQWLNNSFQLYVSLAPGVSLVQVSPKIKDIISRHDKEMKATVFLHPMRAWRLYSNFENGKVSGGFIEYVRMFSIVGILVLLIACINFINLATARSEKRAREVGVRKAIGSGRRELIFQFLVESMLITVISAFLSIGIVELALPVFNQIIGATIAIPYGNPLAWELLLLFVVVTGLIAGSRPAFYLSSFEAVKVLKGTFRAGRQATLRRKSLVVIQFACSVALIISTIIIYQQIRHAKQRPAGYNADGLVFTGMSEDMRRNYDALRNDLLQSGLVENISKASSPVTDVWSHTAVNSWRGKTSEDMLSVAAIAVSPDYFETVGMQLAAGRDFYPTWAQDSGTVIVNEAAVKRMGLTDPVGQYIVWQQDKRVAIAGVVKDAIMESPFKPVEAAVFEHEQDADMLLYRLSANVNAHTAIEKITPIFNKYNPAFPYDYAFADDAYAQKFNLETLAGKLAAIFAGLAIFISCLGLFGLAAFMASQRTKEIAVRKVMGATVMQLWLLLSKDFILLVIVGCAIASPVSFYFLHHWLAKYTYHITIGPGVFIMATTGALVITICTISFQAVRAAFMNPVNSLKAE
ncbi:ABC transporter permease [Chitinophaga sp. MM2321]|uniref:ABC transporter permease n=1 Tax=Chitinophaga sp. MM2321 TaxID=3137178 RepID=UPI0032D57262